MTQPQSVRALMALYPELRKPVIHGLLREGEAEQVKKDFVAVTGVDLVVADERERFLTADVGITGANFLIAETGSIGLVSNEGNARLTTTLPPVHVALVGIEKVIPTVADYATLTQVLPRSATGQAMTERARKGC